MLAMLASLFVPVGIALGLNLSGSIFFALILGGLGASTSVAVLGSFRLWGSSRTFAVLQSAIHEEWKTGRPVLPDWFQVPATYRIPRAISKPTEFEIKRMRRAKLATSDRFALFTMVAIVAGLPISFVLAFSGVSGITLALPVLIPGLTVVGALVLMSRGASTLRLLREYEKATGREVLPQDLR